ncbi:hypothetical protein SAMN06265360_10115 [Haloechinothrix alba]|uniref:Uncharacterized protein n=1 Tax=Haloechinothrix alba TaxID=664784 RepID=A0A238UYF8_9PSEU|nr:hypothetical protein [Haloechinothrix alba]SNR27066.1 hypothetical protein SAMN06265360_10115 [Haloechinothrix alba]
MAIRGTEHINNPGETRGVNLDEAEKTCVLLKGLGVRSGLGTAVVVTEALARGNNVHIGITKRRDFVRAFTLVAAEFDGVLIDAMFPDTRA